MKRVTRATLQFGDWTEAVDAEGPVELLIVRGVAVPMIATFRKMAHALYPNISERKAEIRWAARVGWKFMQHEVRELRWKADKEAELRRLRKAAADAEEKSLDSNSVVVQT